MSTIPVNYAIDKRTGNPVFPITHINAVRDDNGNPLSELLDDKMLGYGECSTAAATAAKAVTISDYIFRSGSIIIVKFVNGISVANATLAVTYTDKDNVSQTTSAIPLYYRGVALDVDMIEANDLVILRYNGTQFELVGCGSLYEDFGASGENHKAGLVPDPGATAGTGKYLREDGTWQTPPDNDHNTKYKLKIGSTWNGDNDGTNLGELESKAASNGGTDLSLVTTGEKYAWNSKGTYSMPSGGIPKTDLASAVQTSLGKADTALQSHQDISSKEDKTNKVTSISSSSTDTQYPSAKCVFNGLQELDTPIPFESTCDIKPYLVKSFGGVSGGSTGIPGFRGEVTYRQALYANGDNFTNKPSTLSGSFNEWRFFKNLRATNLLFGSSGMFTSIVFPDGWGSIETRLIGYGVNDAVCYMDFPESMQNLGGIPFRGTYIYRFHSTTYVPTMTYYTTMTLTKVYVRTGMKERFLADTEWAKYGASVFEEFEESANVDFDDIPTLGSGLPVSSGGVYNALANKANVSTETSSTTDSDFVKMVTTSGAEVKITKDSFVQAMASILNTYDKGTNINNIAVTGTDGKFGVATKSNLASALSVVQPFDWKVATVWNNTVIYNAMGITMCPHKTPLVIVLPILRSEWGQNMELTLFIDVFHPSPHYANPANGHIIISTGTYIGTFNHKYINTTWPSSATVNYNVSENSDGYLCINIDYPYPNVTYPTWQGNAICIPKAFVNSTWADDSNPFLRRQFILA